MFIRRATRYGLLALMAVLVSTAVAWSCVLWAPMAASRPLTEAEAARIIVDRLDTRRFSATPDGVENSGLGWRFVFAVDASIPEALRARRRSAATGGGAAGSQVNRPFTRTPANAGDKYVQIVQAGWPVPCYQGTTEMTGQSRTRHGLFEPPDLALHMGVKPHRLVPLYPRWTGLAVNTIFYGAILWLAIPGPKLLRSALRRRRGQCPSCAYDLAHHEHETCPECGEG